MYVNVETLLVILKRTGNKCWQLCEVMM